MLRAGLTPWLSKLRRLASYPIEARLLAQRNIVSRGANIGSEVLLEAPCNLNDAALFGTISIGAFTYCNNSVAITNADIGRYCSIGQGVIINPGQHPTNLLTTHPFASDISNLAAGLPLIPAYAGLLGSRLDYPSIPMSRHRLTIGHDVWIGARAIIMGGVHVGTGAIIGAGAIVTRDVPPHAVVVGVPARLIGQRLAPELSEAALASHWWDWDLTPLTGEIDYSDVASAIDVILQASAAGRLQKLVPRRHRFTRNGSRLRVRDLA